MSSKMGTDEPLGRNLRGKMVTQPPATLGVTHFGCAFWRKPVSVHTGGDASIMDPVCFDFINKSSPGLVGALFSFFLLVTSFYLDKFFLPVVLRYN